MPLVARGRETWDGDHQGWTQGKDGPPSDGISRQDRGKEGRRETCQPGTSDTPLRFQAHAQAWHSYNSTWRSKQRGEPHHPCARTQPWGGGCHLHLPPPSFLLRSGGDLIKLRLGGTRGHQQPQRHRSCREVPPVLPGLVCQPHLCRRLPSSHEGPDR